MKGYRFAVW